MKKMLLSAYACIPNHGSEQATGWTYATTLSQNGLEVHCLTLKDGRDGIDPILADGYFPNLTVHYVTVPAWVDAFLKKGLIGMYFHYLYWQWTASNMGMQLDRQHTFDLVHHVTYGSVQLGSFMYRLKKPFVFGPVGGGQRAPKAFKHYFGKYWSREWMRDMVGTVLQYVNPAYFRTLRVADQVVVTNQDTFRLVRKLRPTKPLSRIWDAGLSTSFLPNEPVDRRGNDSMTGGPLNLLWVGRLLPRKALELTIQALSKVDPSLPITLTIVGGKGEMAEDVPRYIEQYGVADRINWAGHVSYDTVRDFYRKSDVFFFTSLRDSCPHQLLEAMAYSLPVVTLNLHGQAELVDEKTGIRVSVTTPEQVVADLARAIEWMYAHPDERLAMGRAGYAFAKSQLWETKIRTFIDELYPPLLPTELVSEPAVMPKTNH
ncbi:glycosyltransferase family 4 protein [Spirosoma agri]|uniref:Glycosyltransferase family 4 protein n=1 Tax=Spirosoma agri TaxID=1987381 RepID=A0A6M0IMM4_9BACT|nr:glycosyltransferase family 4 protein [Spirosoma agri]NEU69570.1 glycosyltransferase family 4 protein [Spirosoma agri]